MHIYYWKFGCRIFTTVGCLATIFKGYSQVGFNGAASK